ncbi:MAG: hypothetical protein GDA52_07920 [Rhodobacteraceae bacterium]|nr:hypothetical protein [Paracoccaceae bacterium]
MTKPKLTAAAIALVAAMSGQVLAETSNWTVSTETSPVDDSTNVFLRSKGSEIRDRFGNSKSPVLWIRCMEGQTDFWIWFGGHFMVGRGDKGVVTYRIDSQPAVTRRFVESNDNEYLGLPNNRGIEIIKSMFGHETLFVRATPNSEWPLNMTFPISGIEDVIAPLRQSCNW